MKQIIEENATVVASITRMKLAQALSEMKRLSNLLPELQQLFNDNCIVINGVAPERDPEKLVLKIFGTIVDRHTLAAKIATANAKVKLPCGLTIHEAILRKAELKSIISAAVQMEAALRHGKRAGYGDAANVVKNYGVKPEIVEAKGNEAAKTLRQLEAELQQTNWTEDIG